MSSLGIHAVAAHLPPLRGAAEMAAAAGGDISGYTGWPTVPIAGDDDHPSTMSAAALTEALRRADVDPGDLSLVIAGGMSRDYLPSWSTAAEVMKLCGATDRCLGVDLTDGCLGGLVGLDFAAAWLQARGGGYAAVICSERWSWSVNRADPGSIAMWGYGDGAAALVVGVDTDRPVLAEFAGAEYCSDSELNGHVIVRYGGTRFPVTPPEVPPGERTLSDRPFSEVRGRYSTGYATAIERTRSRYGGQPQRLVCNQITRSLVDEIAGYAGVAPDAVVRTGETIGHVGSADLFLGMDRLLAEGPIDAPAMLAGSTPYVFGAGLLLPPGHSGS